MARILIQFIETRAFSKLVDGKDEVLAAIQGDLLEDPMRWPVIEGTGGARKGRVARPGKGKSGGFRYIYLYVERRGHVYLLFLFGKNKQVDLSPDQKRELKQIVARIKKGG